jgi:hypothetical protein
MLMAVINRAFPISLIQPLISINRFCSSPHYLSLAIISIITSQMAPGSLRAIGLWLKVVHYRGNRVPSGTQPVSFPWQFPQLFISSIFPCCFHPMHGGGCEEGETGSVFCHCGSTWSMETKLCFSGHKENMVKPCWKCLGSQLHFEHRDFACLSTPKTVRREKLCGGSSITNPGRRQEHI